MKPRVRIGIDLGGTKIAAIAISGDDTVLAERRIAAPRGNYDATLQAVHGLVGELETTLDCSAQVGIGMPGSISPQSGVLQNANSVWLNGQDFKSDIEALLARQVRLANDANCFALSEAADGAARDAHTVFGAIIGTGCGGGIVIDGKLLAGRHHIAGEWGHTPLPWPDRDETPGPACWCGKHGCLESWVSGPGLEHDHHATTGQEMAAIQIAQSARNGDPGAQSSLDRHLKRLARGLAAVSNVIDPDVIVLGGGLSNMGHLYKDLPAIVCQYMFADHPAPVVRAPEHGDASGVRGAARLWD